MSEASWETSKLEEKGGKEDRALQATTSDQEHQSSPSSFPFTKEQLDQLYKMFGSQTPSCSIA